MIANIITILHILNVSNESISNGTLQKGITISRVDKDDGFKYINILIKNIICNLLPINGDKFLIAESIKENVCLLNMFNHNLN
jgi:hypothetical protein